VNTNPQGELNAFERLEGLLAQLPAMQLEGERLSRAREARHLLELRNHAQVLEQEYLNYQGIYTTALGAAQEAAERGDAAAQARERGIARSYAEIIATRVAPLQRAHQTLENAWESSALSRNDSLEELALDDAAFAALEQRIASYQQDYQETYSRCQELVAADPSAPNV
jgi:hypothetical protein